MSRCTAVLWDVRWDGDGYGKHGNGPFATKRQAEACLRAIPWPGVVTPVRCTLERSELRRIWSRVAATPVHARSARAGAVGLVPYKTSLLTYSPTTPETGVTPGGEETAH